MKTLKKYNSYFFLMICCAITSCIGSEDFSLPDLQIKEPTIKTDITVMKIQTDLIQEFNSTGKTSYTYRVNDNPTYAIGYVVSSDATGNFYKKLIIQDALENPKGGIEVKVNEGALSETYSIGTKIYLKLDGLTVSYDDGESATKINPNLFDSYGNPTSPGKYTLGFLDHTGQIVEIPSTSYRTTIVKSSEVAKIVPTPIEIDRIEQKHVNTLVQLNNVQFEKNQLGKTFSNELNDSFDGFRSLIECETQARLFLQTSTFASFGSNQIPTGKGKANLVLTKDYRSEFFVLVASSPDALDFTDTNRCDPPILECNHNAATGNVMIFEENFEGLSSLSNSGWTNRNTNGGNNLFSLRSFSGNNYVQASAYNSNETPLEIWLISPRIDLENSTDEVLTFDTKTGYNNGAALTAWISSDYNGDLSSATWLQLDATIADGPGDRYEAAFTSSGAINLSCLSGEVHVAFVYKGADNGVTTTFQIDNIKVTGN